MVAASTIRGIAATAITDEGHMQAATRAGESAYILRSDPTVGSGASMEEPEAGLVVEASTAADTVADLS
jgi:hypothetical protein